MEVLFKTTELEMLYETGRGTGKPKFPNEAIKQYKRKIDLLIAIDSLNDLNRYRSLNFEALKGNRKGEYSIRLNKQFRLIFEPHDETGQTLTINIILINEISKHYE